MAQEAGLLLMSAAMTDECEMIAGLKDMKNPLRTANWWGGELSPVYYAKQKVLIVSPRVRGKDNKEIPLETFQAFRDPRGMRNGVAPCGFYDPFSEFLLKYIWMYLIS